MKLVYVPLDERPCNWKYLQLMTAHRADIAVSACPLTLLGQRKTPADRAGLNAFLKAQAPSADALVLALDTLLYGGLIPSRTHHLDMATITAELAVLRQLKANDPQLKLYCSLTLMRAPAYNSAFEEPDYYAEYGRALFRRAYLQDKQTRVGLDAAEQAELATIALPAAVRSDYENRRAFNAAVTAEVLKLVAQGVIDFLVIPQDDSAPYGYTARGQAQLRALIAAQHLESQVASYPGADEVGSTLAARAYLAYTHQRPKLYPFFASTLGPTIIPLWEDRPLGETLKAHVAAIGARLVATPSAADCLLAINSPGQTMQRAAAQQTDLDPTYLTFRNLPAFVTTIADYLDDGKPVAVCDSAFGNGGDLTLIKALDQAGLLERILSYAGWNTNANTLGTVLADAVINLGHPDPLRRHLIYRLLEDGAYQADVRQQLLASPAVKALGPTITPDHSEVLAQIQAGLLADYAQLTFAQRHPITVSHVQLPWQRLFEVNFELTVPAEKS